MTTIRPISGGTRYDAPGAPDGPGASGAPGVEAVENEPTSGFGLALLLASGVTFLAFLDTTVVNVAFPDLWRSFPRTSLTHLTWVVTAYSVLFAALLASAGRLADILGRRRLFLYSTIAFTVTSLLVAVAPDPFSLIAARALQGAAAAGMIPSALGLLLSHVPIERRAAAVGVWGAAGGMAAVVGPAVGGVMVDTWNWRSVFLINLPIGVLIAFGCVRGLRPDPPSGGRWPDPIGTVAVVLGVGGLVVGLTQGSEWGWDSTAVIGLLAGSVVSGYVGLRRSRNHPAPAVERDLWRNRIFASSNVTSVFIGAGMFAWLLSSPLFLTTIWHYSILLSGVAVTPGALASMTGSILVGRRVPENRQWVAVTIGALLFSAACLFQYIWLDAERAFTTTWLPSVVLGSLGVGAALTGLSGIAAASVPPSRFASGIGLLMTARQTGGAAGIAVMATIITASGPTNVTAYSVVFLFCSAVGVAAVGCAATMRRRVHREHGE